jgi:hypothetical protein
MFLQGTSQVGTAQSWSTTVDLLGPAPPAVEGIGLGSSLLKLSWAANTDPDVVSYRIFCEDLGDTAIHINTYEAGVPARDAASTATCPDASGTSDDAGTGDDDAGDPSDEAGTPTTDAGCTTSTPGTSADAGGGTSACESTLMKGEMLSPDQIKKYDCGTATGQRATSSIVKNLTNGNKYAIAVASSDLVENIGALSDVQCQTPELVNGFDELYRRAGGSAGGASFCSVGLRSAAARSSLWPGAAFLAVVALGRRRRRRPSV